MSYIGEVRAGEREGRQAMGSGAVTGANPFDQQVRLMLQVAMLIFVYTIVIGILNGLDLVEFTRQQLLSHLHAGTLGWMTLAILSASLWLFAGGRALGAASRQSARWLSYLAVGSIALYIVAFATTFGVLRPIAGTATLMALAGFWVWALVRARGQVLTVSHLLVLLGLTSSVIGGTFGVINGFALSQGWTWVPRTFFDAHPGTMEVGFIIPVAMGLAEWGLRRREPPERASRAGLVQAALVTVAFAWVLGFILADQGDVAALGIIFAIVAVVIFFARMWRRAAAVSWRARNAERHAVVGGLLLGTTIVYLFTAIQLAGGDFADLPRGQFIAFIHLMSVGGTTNALLAFVVYLSQRVRPATVLDDVVFWGLTLGVVGFVAVLTIDVRVLIPIAVSVMGVALLTGIAIHVAALRIGPGDASPSDALQRTEAEPIV